MFGAWIRHTSKPVPEWPVLCNTGLVAIRDIDIRNALAAELANRFIREPGTVIVHELGVHAGASRIDIAVVNGILHGFEIKSEADTLRRLPSQVAAYGCVFDEVTIVLSRVHERDVRNHIPAWWGIASVSKDLQIRTVRRAKPNPTRDVLSIARLLWREEALSLLASKDLATGFRGKGRECLYRRIAAEIPLNEVSDFVRMQLKIREGWRSDLLRT